jgi:hypothetical protein
MADPLSQGERHRIYTVLDAWNRGQALPMRRPEEREDIADRVASALDGGPVEVAIRDLTSEIRQLTERIDAILGHIEKPETAQVVNVTPPEPGTALLLREVLAFVREHPIGCAVVWILTWILIVGGSSVAGAVYEDLRVWGTARREAPAIEAPIGNDLLDAAGFEVGPTPSGLGGALAAPEPVE